MRLRRLTAELLVSALCLAAGVALPGFARAAEPSGVTERWLELRIAGVAAGYGHEVVASGEAGAQQTTVDSALVLGRLEARVEISEHEVTIEDRDGRLTTVHSEIRASRDATVLDLSVSGEELAITTTAGGRSYRRVEHESRALLGPEGIRALTAERLAAGAEQFSYTTFVAELGRAAMVTRRLTAREPAAGGQPTRYVLEETSDVLPAPTRLVVAVDGHVVEESQQGPFGDLTIVEATAAVRELVTDGARLPEDLYSRSLLHANVRLPQPRAIDRLRVRIDLTRPQGSFPELEGPYQHVLERARDHVLLEISRAPEHDVPPAAAGIEAPFTQPNFILQSDHPDVVALATSLRRPDAGPYAQARVLQDWVAEHMRFDAGLAMLPASEVVRDRGGTCVAYSVLLSSLARALGIPARIVMGYVYVGNVWGGHAWSEILVGDRWIPLDAAIYRPGPADAAHIALVRHSGEQGAASGGAELLQLFGNESIRIVGYRSGGHWTDVPADALPYVIDGDRYHNPWLGLTVEKPAGFAFAKADATYPDSTVIAIDGSQGGEIRLRQSAARSPGTGPGAWLAAEGYQIDPERTTVAGRAALRGRRDSHAAYAFRDGADLWLLDAVGEDAVRQLDAVAARVTLRAPSAGGTRRAAARQ
jgi:transglutaminase-like putative cysteine protease